MELFDAQRLGFVESAAPPLSAGHRPAMNRLWDEAVRANPSLFDGPAVAGLGLERQERGGLVLSWARATYRYRTLRRIPGAPAMSSVFVSVAQPTVDGRLLVGRMSPSTAAPGRLQLPGAPWNPRRTVSR